MFTKGSSLQGKGNRRDQIIIFSDILACAVRGTKKTALMYRAGLSTLQLHKYVQVLIRSELLETLKHRKTIIYKTTTKGKSFLEAFDALAKLLN